MSSFWPAVSFVRTMKMPRMEQMMPTPAMTIGAGRHAGHAEVRPPTPSAAVARIEPQ